VLATYPGAGCRRILPAGRRDGGRTNEMHIEITAERVTPLIAGDGGRGPVPQHLPTIARAFRA